MALTAIEQVHADWLADPGLFKDFKAFVLARERKDGFDVSDEEFERTFGKWGSIQSFQKQFGATMDAVRRN